MIDPREDRKGIGPVAAMVGLAALLKLDFEHQIAIIAPQARARGKMRSNSRDVA
jgi:hypothetical protein